MENRFTEVMLQRTDIELTNIVTNKRTEYDADALIAAELELTKRNVTIDKLEIANEIFANEQKQQEKIATEPLGLFWKVFAFIFPGGALIIASSLIGMKGYDRKSKELFNWTIYGILFWIILILLIVVL